jgi:uncharacterized protein (TIGR03067 family)
MNSSYTGRRRRGLNFASLEDRLYAIGRRILVTIALCLSVAPLLAHDSAAGEFKKLQGAWPVREHNRRPLDGIQGGVLTISERAFALHTASGKDLKGELRINASTSPRQLDFVHSDGSAWEAIYTVDGDAFKLNYIEAGGKDKRPTLFTT